MDSRKGTTDSADNKDEHRRLVDRERELSFVGCVTSLDLKICEQTEKS